MHDITSYLNPSKGCYDLCEPLRTNLRYVGYLLQAGKFTQLFSSLQYVLADYDAHVSLVRNLDRLGIHAHTPNAVVECREVISVMGITWRADTTGASVRWSGAK